jgi:transcriptional regulator with XRE-family HTH domain
MEAFATLLHRYRKAAGLTQQDLADRSGTSLAAIGALERGVRKYPRPETITALAHALRAGVRADDLVARVGGDEFVVVIVGQDPDEVRPIIERLAASANDDPNLPAGVRVRASLGAAHWSPDGEATWNAAAARADADLYASRSARGIPSRDER